MGGMRSLLRILQAAQVAVIFLFPILSDEKHLKGFTNTHTKNPMQ